MRLGWVNLILGLLIVASTLESGPYAFGAKWLGWSLLILAGVVNVGIGIYAIAKKAGRDRPSGTHP